MEETGTETDDRPLYSRRRTIIMRTVVWVAAAALVLPLVINLYTSNAYAAATVCTAAVRHAAPDANGSRAQFEFFGQGGLGWECYATGGFGGTRHIASLGLFPAPVTESPGGLNT